MTGGLACALLVGGAAAGQMVDPSIDGLVGPFSYLAKPSGLLGGVGAGRGTQVTWDGALYTGEVELCLVTGDPPRPVAVRVKRWGGGDRPIVHYSWLDGTVKMSVSAFASAPGRGAAPATFVRLQMTRLEDGGPGASIGFGLRHSGGDQRMPARSAFNPAGQYAFGRGCALIDDRAVCVLPSGAPSRRYAVVGEPYNGPFAGPQYGVGSATAVLLALWDLGNHAELTVDLKLPWVPLGPEAQQALQSLRQADHERQGEEIAQAWTEELLRGMRIFLPESKPLETYRASLAYLLMSAEIPETGSLRFHDPLRTEALPVADSALAAQAVDRSGRPDLARSALEGQLAVGERATLSALVHHAWLAGDRVWAEGVYPGLRAIGEHAAAGLDAGDLAPGGGEWLATTEALGALGELAALIGKPEEAALFRSRQAEALGAAERALAGTPLPEDAVAPILELNRGLPDSPTPAGLAPQAAPVTDLCRRLRATCEEGLVTAGGLLSPLRTIDLARLHALRGEQEQAIRDLYAVLVHTGSCHEGFAAGVRPWAERDAGIAASPDPRFAAAYVTLLRDLLIREQQDELHLLSGFSPEWLRVGEFVGVHNAPTSFGLVSAAVEIQEGGAAVALAADWHAPPRRIVLHVPYCVRLTAVTADQPGAREIEGPVPAPFGTGESPSTGPTQLVELRPDIAVLTLKWEPRTVAPLSYDSAVEAWREEYAARYREYLAAGKAPVALTPIPLR